MNETRSRISLGRHAVLLSTLATGCLLSACTDGLPTDPGAPAFVVSDGAHGGTAGFYFLPPLVGQPQSMPPANATVDPEVRICAWVADACGATAATYTKLAGTGGETIKVDTDGDFLANWRTDEAVLAGVTSYRIQVLIGSQELGHVDVELVAGGQQLKNLDTEAPIALKDGRTLPIRFRIAAVPAPTLTPRDEREGLAAGSGHTCALDPAGQAWCWGSNLGGQLGIGVSGAPLETPQAVLGGHTFSSITAGLASTCALDAAGAAWCWGDNSEGQIGRGDKIGPVTAPVAVAGGHTFAALSSGAFFTCGRTSTGEVWCWGYGAGGALGTGSLAAGTTPVKVAAPGDPVFTWIEAGNGHACGITAGGTLCWGLNDAGQLGRGFASGPQATPSPATVAPTLTALSAGSQFTCGLDAAGAAWCWGDNGAGQLGRGSVTATETGSAPVIGGHAFVRLTAGLFHTCGLLVTGEGLCWGDNGFGQLGLGTTGGPQPTPQPILEGPNWPVLVGGALHTCAIAFDGTARCWGFNSFRQVGVASPTIVPTHTTIAGTYVHP